jgi:glycosyltransferase involved in cell wall biosynthesis
VRIAVVSPFLDRKHGTERCLIEQLERAPDDIEIHIYSQSIQDLRGVHRYEAGTAEAAGHRLLWHKVSTFPGPHLFRYLFWFAANRIFRWRDAHFRRPACELTYSAGINALDTDAVAVHIVFHEFYQRVVSQLAVRETPFTSWPRLMHRRLYYRLIMALERKVYSNPQVSLAAVSSLVGAQLHKHFQRSDVRIIPNGVDTEELSPSRRLSQRNGARAKFSLRKDDFVVLLIGNDWKKKGLDGLIRALAEIHELPWKLLVVGSDEPSPYKQDLRDRGLSERVTFLKPSPDVLQFYAAADAYAGPSLEDAYGLPVLEAMACGLPVVCSAYAGVSEIVSHGVDGIILNDPQASGEMVKALRSLIMDPDLCAGLGAQAAVTARKHSWSNNAAATWEWLREVAREKDRRRTASR